jgi:hypothetical protein
METPRKNELVITRETRPQRGCEERLNDRRKMQAATNVRLGRAISSLTCKTQNIAYRGQ